MERCKNCHFSKKGHNSGFYKTEQKLGQKKILTRVIVLQLLTF